MTGCRCAPCKEGHRRYGVLRELNPDRLTIDSTGTARRIQALAAIGWSYPLIAARLGVKTPRVGHLARQMHDRVTRTVHDQVATMYRELCMKTPPQGTRAERYAVTRAKAAAAANQWAPPLAWDNIDNPDDTPQGVGFTPGRADLDDWLFLVRAGENPTAAARRLNTTIPALDRRAYRAGRTDITAITNRLAGKYQRARIGA